MTIKPVKQVCTGRSPRSLKTKGKPKSWLCYSSYCCCFVLLAVNEWSGVLQSNFLARKGVSTHPNLWKNKQLAHSRNRPISAAMSLQIFPVLFQEAHHNHYDDNNDDCCSTPRSSQFCSVLPLPPSPEQKRAARVLVKLVQRCKVRASCETDWPTTATIFGGPLARRRTSASARRAHGWLATVRATGLWRHRRHWVVYCPTFQVLFQLLLVISD